MQFSTGPDAEQHKTTLITRVREFNFGIVGRYAFTPLSVVQYDDSGEVIAGAAGDVGLGWLHVDVMWVAQSERGKDLGSGALRKLEGLAREQGAQHARVETTSFQALGFYQKLGYAEFARIEDFPPGHVFYFLRKSLQA